MQEQEANSILLIDNGDLNFSSNISIQNQGSKNSGLNNIFVPLITDEPVIIENLPRILDIERNLSVLVDLGAKVEWLSPNSVKIQCDEIENRPLTSENSLLTTSSKMLIPLMVSRFGSYVSGPSGGDKIGDRMFESYANQLNAFGITSEKRSDGLYVFRKEGIPVEEIELPFPSFGLTSISIFAALGLRHKIRIENVSLEPEIDNTVAMVRSMGASVHILGDRIIEISSPKNFVGCKIRNLSDRNAAVTYACYALANRGSLELSNFDNSKLDPFFDLLNTIGAHYQVTEDSLHISTRGEPLRADTDLLAYYTPYFHSDWLPMVSALLLTVEGRHYVQENLFEDRMGHWKQLEKLGVEFEFTSERSTRLVSGKPYACQFSGPQTLRGGEVRADNVRAGAALLIAASVAHGRTTISGVDQIRRGYEHLIEDMAKLKPSLNITVM